jgi:hypothetical protein
MGIFKKGMFENTKKKRRNHQAIQALHACTWLCTLLWSKEDQLLVRLQVADEHETAECMT